MLYLKILLSTFAGAFLSMILVEFTAEVIVAISNGKAPDISILDIRTGVYIPLVGFYYYGIPASLSWYIFFRFVFSSRFGVLTSHLLSISIGVVLCTIPMLLIAFRSSGRIPDSATEFILLSYVYILPGAICSLAFYWFVFHRGTVNI